MDVIKWARETAEAKGTKFTPLSKDDQHAIAEFVVSGAATLAAANPMADMEGVPTDAKDEPSAAPIPDMEGVPSGKGRAEGMGETKAKDEHFVRRADLLRKCGMSAQAAYDEFLAWGGDNPRESVVMDFATGKSTSGAAFAYWLNEMVKAGE